ncbi:hypothetical protein ACFOOK_30790 [Micromonospora krabiensis]|uniref:Uncharacterized protein n=1 Tax=Micromonospora krabiensis TaxID=307121 RepID=A0A1C3N376_9ACTN|nr:hypothetical protein [Micromonospora krabiensis]SBV27015.1 hypothetical protein GA0070620_2514 [Micromonospora krabiensis]
MLDASTSVTPGPDDIAPAGDDPQSRPASWRRISGSGGAAPGRDRLSVLGGLAALSLDAMATKVKHVVGLDLPAAAGSIKAC